MIEFNFWIELARINFIYLITNQSKDAGRLFLLGFSRWLWVPFDFCIPHLQCGWPLTHFLVEYFYWKRLLELHNYYCVNLGGGRIILYSAMKDCKWWGLNYCTRTTNRTMDNTETRVIEEEILIVHCTWEGHPQILLQLFTFCRYFCMNCSS